MPKGVSTKTTVLARRPIAAVKPKHAIKRERNLACHLFRH